MTTLICLNTALPGYFYRLVYADPTSYMDSTYHKSIEALSLTGWFRFLFHLIQHEQTTAIDY